MQNHDSIFVARSFHDPSLSGLFERQGYVLIDLLEPDAVSEVTRIYRDLGATFTSGWHTDMYSDDFAYRKTVHERVGKVFADRLIPMLDRYRFCNGNFVVKEADPESAIPPHQDWTIVDNERFRSINVICPLVDTDEENGQLFVVPGSHLPPKRISFGPIDELVVHLPTAGTDSPYLVPLRQRAGQALVYDGRLLHASTPNTSGSVRIAFSAGFIPIEADVLHYYRTDESPHALEVYEIDDAFFYEHTIGNRPARGRYLRTIQSPNTDISEDQLRAWQTAALG